MARMQGPRFLSSHLGAGLENVPQPLGAATQTPDLWASA